MAAPKALVKGFDGNIESYKEMEKYPMELNRFIHENFSVVMSFAYSRRPLVELIDNKFSGYNKYLEKAIFEIGEKKANRAIIELAILIRILDDEERINNFDKRCGMSISCGSLILKDDKVIELTFREFSNKIIHARTFKWDFSASEPRLICHARDDDSDRWIRAEVDLVGLAAFCGRLIS